MADANSFRFECCGLVCDASRLAEVDGGRVVAVALRRNVRHIRYCYGFVAPHPVIQIALGAALSIAAGLAGQVIFDWLRHGGVLPLELAYLVPTGVIGLWLIVTAFRRRHYLRVTDDEGATRLVFHRSADRRAIDSFICDLEQNWDIKLRA